ncbi:hypothetical protein B9Z55_014250 [Caenorhabditis nigoni]|uniref:Serpentine receptor class gamma n=1 Tax=Caenorhabditis nigoni TaxID=1611254 RepID=A0A2G5U556_9PELO|nr:hypothetical protein B9Z55_014250 [Caenorhabditis nigoni]
MNNVSIQGDVRYINYEFDWFTFPVLCASIPLIYLLPTIFVMTEIVRVYCRQLITKRDELMNPHVFFVIVLSQLMICEKIVKISTPFVFIYPLLFTFTLIPALGFCRQLLGPYQFGAIYIFFSGNWFNLKLANLLVLNVVFFLFLSTAANILLYWKLKTIRNKRKSVKLQRAESSLTFTTLSMLSAYITNLIFVIMFIIHPPLSTYVVALRPFGNDCDIVLVPWIFYLTHPAFKKKLFSNEVSRVRTLHTTI